MTQVPATHRIELRGNVSDRMLAPYSTEFVITRDGPMTTMTGVVKDAAHLHGILTYLTGVGIEVHSVSPLAPIE